MNTYRIDTFKLENGTWKAVVYQCGRFIGEAEGLNESRAVQDVSHVLMDDIQKGWNL